MTKPAAALFTAAQVAGWRAAYGAAVDRAERLYDLIRAAENVDPVLTDSDGDIPFGLGPTARVALPALAEAGDDAAPSGDVDPPGQPSGVERPLASGGTLRAPVPVVLDAGFPAMAIGAKGRPRGAGVFWTAERNRRLRDGVGAGERYADIAAAIGHGCTTKAAMVQMAKLRKKAVAVAPARPAEAAPAAADPVGDSAAALARESAAPAEARDDGSAVDQTGPDTQAGAAEPAAEDDGDDDGPGAADDAAAPSSASASLAEPPSAAARAKAAIAAGRAMVSGAGRSPFVARPEAVIATVDEVIAYLREVGVSVADGLRPGMMWHVGSGPTRQKNLRAGDVARYANNIRKGIGLPPFRVGPSAP